MTANTESDKRRMENLYDFLMIKNENTDLYIIHLDNTIARTKIGMSKENIAWVEQMVESMSP